MTLTKQEQHLYLFCVDLSYFPDDYSFFIKACEQKGLIAQSDLVAADEYLAGDSFLQQVSFLGCSPTLKVFPDNDRDTDYCRITIPTTSGHIKYKSGHRDNVPRCPGCRKAGQFPESLIQQWHVDKKNINIFCNHCKQSSPLYHLDWRRNAGFYNFYIGVSNIFPKEAIPSQALLDWLANISNRDWKYFYA